VSAARLYAIVEQSVAMRILTLFVAIARVVANVNILTTISVALLSVFGANLVVAREANSHGTPTDSEAVAACCIMYAAICCSLR